MTKSQTNRPAAASDKKEYTIILDEANIVQLGTMLDTSLRDRGVQHVDIISEIRRQIQKQLPEKTEDQNGQQYAMST